MVKVTLLMTLALLSIGQHVQHAEVQTKAQVDSHFSVTQPSYSRRPITGTKGDSSLGM